ncbi:Peptidoglycan glycosyltransferase [Bacillus methanolicus PB1]|uniref:serine-type D-Ala-D-Ala carboxypeptidase n=1 Tax=Bacillus methanolicus PB1 TaxID=997296 RepID=I3E1J1_BACMT|nr:penicillin-binding transpeptidase domain-containing protein [Bacillus methanolicus]EIJ80362.1 Peptidoglycan glycosyltransferase [Bacillus methanolicus PB1]
MRKSIYLLLAAFIVTVLASCNKEPKPEDRFDEYIKLWNAQKFDKMYEFLSDKVKEKVTKEEFTSRYEKVYRDLEITDLKVKFDKPEEGSKPKEDKIEFPFSVKMNSIAGPIKFNHSAKLIKEKREDEKNWYVDWDTTYIFPELKKGDKIQVSTIPAKRGEILDRNGNGLAVNGTAYEIGIVPEKMGEHREEIINQVAALLEMEPEKIGKLLNAGWVQPNYFVPIKKISKEDRELFEKLVSIPSVLKKDVEARVYPYKESAAHLIGYVGPITADELKELEGKGYSSNDMIGKRGLEQVLEERLKGENGAKITIKKADGIEVLLKEKEVKNGENITLTIDAELQAKVFKEMNGEPGTASAINPKTGETLALVSSPSFDPNKAALGMSSSQWKELQDNKNQPLLTRFKATYAPGSVIKPLVAAIGLKEGAITPEKTINVKGKQWQKDNSWGNYKVTRVKDPKGPVNLEKALVYSDNIYFAQTALELGKERFATGLKMFGFEEEIPYPFPIESSKLGEMDTEIKLADSGYGQGQVEMSIVHLAASYTPFINKGNMIKPVLFKEEAKGEVWHESIISEAEANLINSDLLKVVEDPQGTAHTAKIDGYPIAGKTGTAEFKKHQGEKGTENGSFVAYNANQPEILIAMMLENVQDKGGSKTAVSKVKKILSK